MKPKSKCSSNNGPSSGGSRTLEVRLLSAQDLKDVRHIERMRCYALVYVNPQDANKLRTRVDENGGTNPVWNELLTLSVPEERLRDPMAGLTIDIFSHGHLHDKLVGTVRILLSDIFSDVDTSRLQDEDRDEDEEEGEFAKKMDPILFKAYLVRMPSGDPQGILNVWIPPSGRFLRHLDSTELSSSCPSRDLLPTHLRDAYPPPYHEALPVEEDDKLD